MSSLLHPSTWSTRTKLVASVGGVVVCGLLIWFIVTLTKDGTSTGFLDYMPDVPRPCPSDYRCGGTSREQMAMEHRLYVDLREGSKYALPETMTKDAYDVIATEAEPTSCMLQRAAKAQETPIPEGQYTPYDEIEQGFLERKKKTPMLAETALTSK